VIEELFRLRESERKRKRDIVINDDDNNSADHVVGNAETAGKSVAHGAFYLAAYCMYDIQYPTMPSQLREVKSNRVQNSPPQNTQKQATDSPPLVPD
jgi:hypothetical protein